MSDDTRSVVTPLKIISIIFTCLLSLITLLVLYYMFLQPNTSKRIFITPTQNEIYLSGKIKVGQIKFMFGSDGSLVCARTKEYLLESLSASLSNDIAKLQELFDDNKIFLLDDGTKVRIQSIEGDVVGQTFIVDKNHIGEECWFTIMRLEK